MRLCFVITVLGGVGVSAASADIVNFRSWLDANATTPNSASNEWFGTQGINGAMMTSDGSLWYSPGFPNSTPLLALRNNIGTNGGAAGPATFNGSWAHPGPGIAAVLVFAPTAPMLIGQVDVRSELIANGLSGNGVTISVLTTIAGNTTSIGTVTLAGTADERMDSFTFPTTLFQPGDRVHIAFGDNGSYLFDHVNYDATIGVPTPAAGAALGLGVLLSIRRRR